MLRIYLSGSVRKGDLDPRDDDSYWSDTDEEAIRKVLFPEAVELRNPQKTGVRRADLKANFGCDLYLVSTSDVVLVDARTRKGIGIGAEMMFATFRKIPVITLAPINSHYRRAVVPNLFGENVPDWTHPFVFGLSDYIVESLEDVAPLLRRCSSEGHLPITKDPEEAIAYFRSLSIG